MSALDVTAAVAVGAGLVAVAGICIPPTRRLAPRVRPYTLAARAALGNPPDVVTARANVHIPGVVGRIFGPALRALLPRTGAGGTDDRLARLLDQAGQHPTSPDDFRVRQLAHGAIAGVVAAIAIGLLMHAPVAALVGGVAAFFVGSTRPRKRLERAVADRARRIRQELYTVNHLLAMQIRTGSGPIQAVQRIVDRGRGAVVDDLAAMLASIRHGTSDVEAFRAAADRTPEPGAARTYHLLAASAERGSDLGTALLALSEDLRDARREQLHKDAVRRRAAMLVPTIAILAPIMLLFIAAPLPSIVLGNR